MVEAASLPKFRHPPLEEVALGAQFNPLNFSPTFYGAFHQRVRSDFPVVQASSPLHPCFESFDVNTILPAGNMLAMAPPNWTRAFFVSADDTRVIQLQPDRLYVNWRKRAESHDYPHYDILKKSFAEIFAILQELAYSENVGEILINQCDLLYVNSFATPQVCVDGSKALEDCFRVWRPESSVEWSAPLDDLSFNLRYRLNNTHGAPVGRLTAACSTMRKVNAALAIRLEVMARGMPHEPNLLGIQAFHDMGHEAIVKCFAAITTPRMHSKWERFQ